MKYLLHFIFVFILFLPSPVFADIYTPGTRGYDISFPQCHKEYPSPPYTFGIVGVNGGKAFTHNSCLFTEYFWAKHAETAPSLYMNLNYPSGETSSFGMSGCSKDDDACQAYHYGYYAAEDAYRYALLQFATSNMWWIDIETANTWSDDTLFNNKVLDGTIDFLKSAYVQTGVYSTKKQWTEIMGSSYVPTQNFIEALPNWIGGAADETAPLFCLLPFIPKSRVALIQYANDIFDGDYACL